MKRSLLPGLLAAALLTTTLTACDTGSKPGDTNVEESKFKDKNPNEDHTTRSDSATLALKTEATENPTGREIYENADEYTDRNNDGKAD